MSATARIAFVGLGAMGGPMANRIRESGHDVIGFDADPELPARFGGGTAADPSAVADAGVIITMLPTSAIVAEALIGPTSVLRDHLAPGALVIDMSSSQPFDTIDLGSRLADRGVRLADAPVSGGVAGALAGTLTIMVGAASDSDFDLVAETVAPLGSRVVRVGGPGAGHAMKALNNYVASAGFVAASEALVVAERYGLDPAVFIDVVNTSTGKNFSTDRVIPNTVLTETWDSGFALALMAKDVGIAAELSERLEPAPVLVRRVADALAEARDALPRGADHSRAVAYWRALAQSDEGAP